jgi:hypothetical protein
MARMSAAQRPGDRDAIPGLQMLLPEREALAAGPASPHVAPPRLDGAEVGGAMPDEVPYLESLGIYKEPAAPPKASLFSPGGLRVDLAPEKAKPLAAIVPPLSSLEDVAFARLGARPVQKKPAAAKVAAHKDSESIGDGDDDDDDDSESSESVSDDDAPMKAMKATKALPMKCAKPTMKPPVTKKPAAKHSAPSKVTKKRFDKSAFAKQFKFPGLTKSTKKGTTHKNFASKAYHNCLSAAKRCGFTEPDAKDKARRAFSKATTAWNAV